ncbi:MAG: type I DNA topoisomerase [Bacillota bacterium]
MSKALIIVESPAKAKTIEKFLGRRYMVKASMGHVRDLPRSQFGVDVEHGFLPKYITIRGKGDVLKELRDSVKKADRVLLATDPDREGEAISWHLAQVLKLDGDGLYRVEFNEITKDVVREAVKHPRRIDSHLVEAQQARRVLDRLVGYKLSPLLWRKLRPGLSAGRVQSAALRLICDREKEINEFRPEEYWTLTAQLATAENELLQARYHGPRLNDESSTRAIMDELQREAFTVSAVNRRERRRMPPPPFSTSTLQQEAWRKLGFAARRTMRVAQQLYEGLELKDEGAVGLITYMRTDSTRVGESAANECRAYIAHRFGGAYVGEEQRAQAVGRVQGAHECIRPTSVLREPEKVKASLTGEQQRLYRLIWERFVASQMSPAVYDTVTVEVLAGRHQFRVSGSTVKFAGFMLLYIEGRDEEETEPEGNIPALEPGARLRVEGLHPQQHHTQPPPRYTEATLVKALEEKGIGRPSTYAPIIDTVEQRGYARKEEKRFRPTELGCLVTELLQQYFPNIIDIEFTAGLEDQLDLVEAGKASWQEIVAGFFGPFEERLEQAEAEIGGLELGDEETEEKCKECGRNLVIKHGRYGRFLACPGFPECRYTRPLLEEIGVSCIKCGRPLVERRSKRGRTFYGCSGYPECDFVSWNRPVARTCPECGQLLVEKTTKRQGTRYVCSGRECDYQEVPDSDHEN